MAYLRPPSTPLHPNRVDAPALYFRLFSKLLPTLFILWNITKNLGNGLTANLRFLSRMTVGKGRSLVRTTIEPRARFYDELHPYATLSYGSSLFSHCLFKFSCILKIPSKAFFGLFLRFTWKEERNKRWVDLWTTCFIDEQNRLAASRILTSSRVGCSQFVGVFFLSFFVPYFFSYCFHPIS